MKKFVDEFLNYLSIERGLSKNTISSYRTDLVHFMAYLEGKGISNIERINRQDIMNYLLSLKDKGISGNSVRQCVKEGKSFRYLVPEAVFEFINKTKLYGK